MQKSWDLQDKIDREKLTDKATKEELEYQKNVTEMMCKLLQQQAALNLEIDIFDGSLQMGSGK